MTTCSCSANLCIRIHVVFNLLFMYVIFTRTFGVYASITHDLVDSVSDLSYVVSKVTEVCKWL